MIKILYPPGGYGTYLARCLYSYTNLNDNPCANAAEFNFDQTGSSHVFHYNLDAKTKIWWGHPVEDTWCIGHNDLIIVVQPNSQHYLDYDNNHFDKWHHQDLIKSVTDKISIDEINRKLETEWGYNGTFNIDTPRWILREFFSLWIVDCLRSGHSLKHYSNVPNVLTIDTQDIILNFVDVFDQACKKLELTKTVNEELIINNHKNFLKAQKYHNSQLNCKQWVHDTINEKENPYIPKTIFKISLFNWNG